MHEVVENINRINIEKNEWFTKKEVARAMEKNFIPLCRLEELYDYTKGNPFLIQFYLDNYNGKDDVMLLLKKKLIEIYEEEYNFNSINEFNLIATCIGLKKISYSLFANLAYHYRLSSYQLNKFIKEKTMFYEDNGFYIFYPFFLDYLNKKVEQSVSDETKGKLRTILVSNLILESNFLLEYYKFARTKIEKIAMEKKIIDTIIKSSYRYYENELKTFDYSKFEDQGLKLLVMMISETDLKINSINYFLKDLSKDALYDVLLKESTVYLAKKMQIGDSIYENSSDEGQYFKLIRHWVKGEKTSLKMPEKFYEKYGFFNVPDHLIYQLDEVEILRESDNRLSSFLCRISVLYKYYLRGEIQKSSKLFHYIIRWYKNYLLKDYPGSYYFILAWHYFNKKSLGKSLWYIQEGFKKINFEFNKIFILKYYNLYLRILFEQKDISSLLKLLSDCKDVFGEEKPFQVFMEYLRGCIRLLEGQELDGCLDDPILYSMNIGDEISAVQYLSYSLNDKDRENNSILKVQESLLSSEQLAIYHNTSLFDAFKKVDLEINFFGPCIFKINNTDYANEFLNRKKLRKIMNYLIFNSPNMVSREEIKRVFWDKDKAFDIDANLRVTICNIRKILDKLGYSDMIVCEQARIYINSRYLVNNDFKKYVALYKKAKLFFKNRELYQAETYLKRIVSLNIDVVFKDLSWDYLENKVRNQVQLIICNSLEMLLSITKSNNNWLKAEDYARRLTSINGKHLNELICLLQKNGRIDEAEDLIRSKSKQDKSLTNIFFPE
ncbi:MAG: hypothetical protein FD141_1411 [Fusobacteria bacterium]|nr:MAG: hypothetical protein FD141_1411 [Fusobacteriota bacterium]KAF0230124.1 MAG: hypothetical protein FD182_514 [Fusobacteriota bacterium]